MTTVSSLDRWFDECAESVLGLPVAEAVLDVMSAGLHVEIARPGVRRVRDGSEIGVALVASRRGIVVDVMRIDARPIRQRRGGGSTGRIATA